MSRHRDPELTEMVSFRLKPTEKARLDELVRQVDPRGWNGGRSNLLREAALEYVSPRLTDSIEGVA